MGQDFHIRYFDKMKQFKQMTSRLPNYSNSMIDVEIAHVFVHVGHCYWSKVQCTSVIVSLSQIVFAGILGSCNIIDTFDVIHGLGYLMLLILLSGDIELNPGPVTGKH